MNPGNCFRRGLLIAAASLILGGFSAANAEQVVRYALGADGTFVPVATYDLNLAEAIANYKAAFPGALHAHDSPFFSATESNSEEGRLVGSSAEFFNYLDTRYGQAAVRTNEDCDFVVLVTWTLGCPVATCAAANDPACEAGVTWKAAVTCPNNPPCPGGVDSKRFCRAFTSRIIGITTNQQACDCAGGAGAPCNSQPGTVVTGFVTAGPICQCAIQFPAFTQFGLAILFSLIAAAGVIVIRRSRMSSAA